MPNAPARHRQADLARAIRAMKSVFGNAEVVFETDGRVRILPSQRPAPATESAPDNSWDDFDEPFPMAPRPIRDITAADVATLKTEMPHRSEEWIRQQPTLPFHGRERGGLEQLLKRGAGVFVPLGELRNCGRDTIERLLVRGYVEIRRSKTDARVIASAAITPAGVKALEPPPWRPGGRIRL